MKTTNCLVALMIACAAGYAASQTTMSDGTPAKEPATDATVEAKLPDGYSMRIREGDIRRKSLIGTSGIPISKFTARPVIDNLGNWQLYLHADEEDGAVKEGAPKDFDKAFPLGITKQEADYIIWNAHTATDAIHWRAFKISH